MLWELRQKARISQQTTTRFIPHWFIKLFCCPIEFVYFTYDNWFIVSCNSASKQKQYREPSHKKENNCCSSEHNINKQEQYVWHNNLWIKWHWFLQIVRANAFSCFGRLQVFEVYFEVANASVFMGVFMCDGCAQYSLGELTSHSLAARENWRHTCGKKFGSRAAGQHLTSLQRLSTKFALRLKPWMSWRLMAVALALVKDGNF